MDIDIFFQLSKKDLNNVVFFDLRNIFPELKLDESNQPFSQEKLPTKPLSFNSISEFSKYLKNESIVIINGFGDQKIKTWRLSFILSKNKIPVISIHNKSGLLGALGSISKTVEDISSPIDKYIKKFLFVIYLLMLKTGLQSKYDTYFVSGRVPSSNITKYGTKFNEIIEIHNRTYDEFIKFGPGDGEGEYIVFLDVAMPFILDFIEWGIEPLDADDYYNKLNIFFDKLEKIIGKEIVICAHPQFSQDYKNKYFPNKRVVWFQTNEFITNASLVIVHFTNALQYALLHKKKILLLDDDSFNPYIREAINFCVKNIGIKKINYSSISEKNLAHILKNLQVDNNKYDEFINDYLKKQDEINSSEKIILETLEKKYHIT
ncbi:hypothetical protein OAQ86_06860 [Candidatus Pseudothioglobus singularis]|nr:hypothetical protein [Candidatus Pseudothioglobus singularis]